MAWRSWFKVTAPLPSEQGAAISATAMASPMSRSRFARSVAIEFDTFDDFRSMFPDLSDADGNHVAINLNGSMIPVASAYVGSRLNDGSVWTVWIDYDSEIGVLETRSSNATTRPDNPLLAYNLDLATILGSSPTFAGFTAPTRRRGDRTVW
jgi:hypothetical protein